jgi:hypothetical protein
MSRRAALAALAAASLAGCQPTPPSASLFPLEPGRRWVYDVRTDWDQGTVEHETRVITTEGRAEVAGEPAWRRRSADGVDWYLRADASGVYRVASKSDVDADPRPDEARRYVLKMPLAVGTSWQQTTTAYLLRRGAEFPPEIRHTHPAVPMTYTIVALDVAVDTLAGPFRHCVQVQGQAALKLFVDPVAGWRDLPLTTTEWYCPGAGLVKLVRAEPAHSSFLAGGRLTMDLTAWSD